MKIIVKSRIPTSSNRAVNIFLSLRPLENLSKTPVNPFMNAIFSSRGLEAKFERSRKLRVEIGSELKNELFPNVSGVGRPIALRVINK
jgi:hypothetical protein